ncbi:unnamed protein product [Linum trigynum]
MLALFPVYDDGSPLRSDRFKSAVYCEIWVLLKYWVPESWTRLLVITSPPEMKIGHRFHSQLSRNLKCFFVDEANNTITVRDECVVVYSPETRQFSELGNMGDRILRQIVTSYVPSQIALRDYYCMSE